MAYIARTNDTREEIPVPVTIEKVKEVLGADTLPERVCPRFSPDVIFICDEDGLRKQLPLNQHGAELYGGPIVGDIIVMTRNEARKSGWL